MRFAAVGVLVGVAGFYVAAPAFRSVLYEVSSTDSVTIVHWLGRSACHCSAGDHVAVSGALRVDPAIVLRDE